ncbi:MAG: T9SS type A sorting domain-containing protein, partial [Dysgonamonadaceae bacterium]|nr:T9SS type A sorting domain-containing protein [Dysgonamonadaceae bacterium]
VLVIDRSGTGNFNPADVEYIPVSETDALRQKAIFHNVFFDRDGNGTDVFTFAYGKAEALGNLQISAPTCGQDNGKFTLNVDWGVRGFNYVLKDKANDTDIRSGWEGSRSIHVAGLATGVYELTVTEAGGYTFESAASSGGLLRAKTTNFLPVIDGNIIWRVSNTSDTCSVGYTASTDAVDNPGNVFLYGLKQAGNRIYKIENGNATLISNVTLQAGDELKIEKGILSLDYKLNGNKTGSSIIRLQDHGQSFYGLIDFGQGPTELLNANAEGFFNLIDYRWNMTGGVVAVRASGASKKYTISIPECRTGIDVIDLPGSSDSRLTANLIPGTRTLRIALSLEAPESVSLLIYDVRGIPAAKAELPAAQTVHTTEVNLPQTGVYIIKAITSGGKEYGSKIIIN